MQLKGSLVALVTPFDKQKVDEAALRQLVDIHLKSGTSGLVPVGTTGESPTLSHEEHEIAVEIVIDQAGKKLPIVAGTGSNSTSEAISLTRHARQAGASATLQVAPYYNKPNQLGLFRHYKAIGDKGGLPIVLYNHKGRTNITIEPATIKALSDVVEIVAVKDASGGADYSAEVLDLTGGKVAVLSGNDAWTLPLMSIGAAGVISVVGNIAPKDMAGLCEAALAGDFIKARKLHYKLLPLMRAMELEVNPVPVKAALAMMGLVQATVRSPLAQLSANSAKALKKALKDYKLIK
jgi:4-hydroxy-tetrahydrodipicolinate synthase